MLKLASDVRTIFADYTAAIDQLEETLQAEKDKAEHGTETGDDHAARLVTANDNELMLSGTIQTLQTDNESRLLMCERTARYWFGRDSAKTLLRAAETEIPKIKIDINVTEPELESAKEALDKMEGECGQLRDEAGRLEAELDNLRKRYALVEKLCDAADKTVEGKAKEAVKARQEATFAVAEAERAARELRSVIEQRQALERDNGVLEKNVALLQDKHNQMASEAKRPEPARAEPPLRNTGTSLRRKRKLEAIADIDPTEEIAGLRRLVKQLRLKLRSK